MQTDIQPADLWPAILSGLRAIDWRESASVFFDGLAILAILTTHAAYRSGYGLGRWVHTTNDRLASLSRRLLAPEPVAANPTPEPMEVSHPEPIQFRPLSSYPVRELRTMARNAGHPSSLTRRGRKADLIAALAY